MGLSKPIIVNTQQVTVTEQAVDLSGIENTLATIKADASAAKTSAAQAAEAAMEGGGPPECIGITNAYQSLKTSEVTIANVTGKGRAKVTLWDDSGYALTPTITVDGTAINGLNKALGTAWESSTAIPRTSPLSSGSVFEIELEFNTSFVFKAKSSDSGAAHVTIHLY